MKVYNRKSGAWGEEEAKKYLKAKGYQILRQNYSNKLGEIDLICLKDGYLIFVEVKTRLTNAFGSPAQSVNFVKQQKIRKTALAFLSFYGDVDKDCRFDVIEVLGDQESFQLNHIENAF